jgi:hypothetical protein
VGRRGLVALLCAASLAAPGAARAGNHLIVGVDDDTIKWLVRPAGILGVDSDLGLDAVRLTIPWKRGQSRPTRLQQVFLHRIALMVAAHERVVLAVYGRAGQAPLTPRDQAAYCGFVAHAVVRIPLIRDVVIWNEANNPSFWPQSAGAPAYESLLARCWDALHSLRQPVNVIDSTAPHQDPGSFIAALGLAYRLSGRLFPIVDTFGHNVYPESSSEPPWTRHDSTSIDEGDYARLMGVLASAFGGTMQPLPGVGRTTIWYLEDGFQTVVPADKLRPYTGRETERRPLPALAESAGAAAVARDQAAQLRDAIDLAYCQPAVGAFFNFELIDDHRFQGWQSGVLWADGTKKPSYEPLKATIAGVHAGVVDCTRFTGQG